MTTFPRTAGDTGVVNSDAIRTTHRLSIPETGLAQSDALASRRGRRASDAGLVQTDAIARTLQSRVLVESYPMGDLLLRKLVSGGVTTYGAALLDTASALTESLEIDRFRRISDSLTFSDSLARVKIGTMSLFDFDSVRTWDSSTTERAWFVNGYTKYYGRSGDATTPLSRKE